MLDGCAYLFKTALIGFVSVDIHLVFGKNAVRFSEGFLKIVIFHVNSYELHLNCREDETSQDLSVRMMYRE